MTNNRSYTPRLEDQFSNEAKVQGSFFSEYSKIQDTPHKQEISRIFPRSKANKSSKNAQPSFDFSDTKVIAEKLNEPEFDNSYIKDPQSLFKKIEKRNSDNILKSDPVLALQAISSRDLKTVAQEANLDEKSLILKIQVTLRTISSKNNIIGNDRMYNDFMHYADLWEKVLLEHVNVINLYTKGTNEQQIIALVGALHLNQQVSIRNYVNQLINAKTIKTS